MRTSKEAGGWRLEVDCVRVLALALALAGAAACRQDMHDQPKYEPLEAGPMFNDGQSARPLVEDTVARGHLEEDEQFFTGKVNGQLADTFPYPVTADIVNRGQERFNVFCSPCHDRAGTGRGMVVRRGYRQPPSFHDQRLKAAPVGYFFDVMTNGFGAMPDYRAQIPAADRWAIVSYIRALQRTTGAPTSAQPQPGPVAPGNAPGTNQQPAKPNQEQH
ncbi:MAG: c-type cytochrome [Acidobacteriota bacterium]